MYNPRSDEIFLLKVYLTFGKIFEPFLAFFSIMVRQIFTVVNGQILNK